MRWVAVVEASLHGAGFRGCLRNRWRPPATSAARSRGACDKVESPIFLPLAGAALTLGGTWRISCNSSSTA